MNWQILTTTCVFLSLLIGAARLFVSYRQHQTFKKNIRPGVRDRQQTIYNAITNIIRQANTYTYLSTEDIEQFKHDIKDSDLLFEMEQQRYLRTIKKKVMALYKVSVPLQTLSLTKEKWNELSRKQMELLEWFNEQENTAKDKFKDYLSHWV